MKSLALLAGAAAVTAVVMGGTTAIAIGNLGLLAGAGALFLCTLNLEKAPR